MTRADHRAEAHLAISNRFDTMSQRLQRFSARMALLDEQPPLLGAALGGDANTDTSLYDLIGRRYFLSLRVRF